MSDVGKIIFAIHSAGMSAAAWEGITAGLQHPCHACTLPGHEKTGGKLLPSIEEMAGWVKTQLSGRPEQSVVLMGHSMGALVALETADHPAVSALVLLGASARMPVHPELLRLAKEDRNAAIDMILKWGVSPGASAARTVLKEQMRVTPPDALPNDLTACHAYQNGAGAAKEIPKPALILSGQNDKMIKPDEEKILGEMLRGARFRVIGDCGHMLMAEKPDETAAEINRFLRGM